ncbi:MAG TPA: hypothetical protein ENN21_06240 [Spirochaetes bacterium]|nr:hypothetical protein [Spirochaetota bacterium]
MKPVNRTHRAYLRRLLISAALVFFAALGAVETSWAAPADEYNWFWMFYEKDRTPEYATSVYRPFYMKNRYNSGKTFEASLMPVVFWRYGSERSTEWKSLLGLVGAVDYRHSNGVKDYDFGIFPLALYGDSPDVRDRYLFVLPVGGVIKGKLAQDRIGAWAFPGIALFFLYPPSGVWMVLGYAALSLVPVYYTYQAEDYRAAGFFWPLFLRGKGSKRDDIKVLPFYAHKYKKDTYDNYSFLLLANFNKTIMKDDNQYTSFIFPFYGRRWNTSEKVQASTLFWPFFSWGYNKKAGDFALNFPWPLMMVQDSRNPYIYKRIFFPFYGKYIYNKSTTTFLTPLYFHMVREGETYRSEYFVNLIIVWYYKRDYRERPDIYYGKHWRYFKIWPLFHYEYNDRNFFSFNLLSLWPFRDRDGYELLYQPFWTLFEYRRLESGEKRLGFLFRTYYQRWNEGLLQIKIPLVMSYHKEKDRLTRFSFLLSMFGYARDDAGTRIRLFWVPITLREGTGRPDERKTAAAEQWDLLEDSDLAMLLLARSIGRHPLEEYRPTGNYMHYSMRFF